MRRLMVNLIENAAKHAGPEVEISLIVSKLGCGPTVVVRDDGVGIPEEHQEHVFDR
ncbi:sensor histidine kinase, partial [Acinetobacter baumannii]